MNNKGYFNLENALFTMLFMLGTMFIFWMLIIQPALLGPQEKQSAIESVTELQNNYDAVITSLNECTEKYNNCESKDYLENLETQADNNKNTIWFLICGLIIAGIVIIIYRSLYESEKELTLEYKINYEKAEIEINLLKELRQKRRKHGKRNKRINRSD